MFRMLLEHFVDTEKRPPIRLYDERQTRSQSISQLNNIQTGTRTDRQTDRQTDRRGNRQRNREKDASENNDWSVRALTHTYTYTVTVSH